MPEISVVMPVYNAEKWLQRAVDSIFAQTFQDFELILIDDGSKDASPALCDSLAEQKANIVVRHKENGGQSSARNLGLTLCRGNYIAFVDCDDWIESKMFENLHRLLKEHPDAQMAQCGMVMDKEIHFLNSQNPEKISIMNQKQMLEYFFRIHGEASNDSICNRLYRRDLLEGFTFTEVKHEDVIACYEFFHRANKMVVSSDIYYHYFVNDAGVTRTFQSSDLKLLDVWDLILKRTKAEHPEYVNYAVMGRKRANFTLLAKMKLRGVDKNDLVSTEAKKKLKKAVRRDFVSLMRWKMPVSRKILLILVCI